MAAASLWLSPCHRAAGELAECLARLRRQLSHAACIQHLHVQNGSARGQSAGVSSAQREWACVPGCSPLQCHQAQAGAAVCTRSSMPARSTTLLAAMASLTSLCPLSR